MFLLFPALGSIFILSVLYLWPGSSNHRRGCRSSSVPFSWSRPETDLRPESGRDAAAVAVEKGRVVICEDPATGRPLGTVPSLSPVEVTNAVGRAASAAKTFNKTSISQRKIILQSLLDWLVAESETLCRMAARDTGKTMVDAFLGEILVTAEKLRWILANVDHVLADESRSNPLLLLHKRSKVVYEPLGLVSALVSWNYPVHNLLSPIIAAIATGNAIVVKSSELVAWSSLHLAEAVKSCLAACGHNPDVVQVLVGCEAEAAEALTGDERLDALLFIGSEQVGRQVAARAGAAGTQVTLELGGKDAALLLPSANIAKFKDTFLRASFQSAGQNCVGIERFIVHESCLDDFLDAVSPIISDMHLGAALDDIPRGQRVDMGSMISERAVQNAEGLVQQARKEGARVIVGGQRFVHPDWPQGHYFQPTLIHAAPHMEIAQSEVFGPVMLVLTYKTVDEAVEIANGTRYGLGGAVFGASRSECEAVGRQMKCGMVSLNDFAVTYMNQGLPFGAGKKGSGYGRFGGPEGLRSLCSVKAVVQDRFHGLVQTQIPPPLAYPIQGQAAWQFVQGLLKLAYGSGVNRIKGLIELIRA